MQYRGAVLKDFFIGKIRLEGGRGEKDKRRISYCVLEAILDNYLDLVFTAKPFFEMLRLVTVQVVQVDLAELPIPK